MALRASGDRIKETIRSGKAELLQIKAGDMNKSIGPEGFNPLHWACHYGQVKVRYYFYDLQIIFVINRTSRSTQTLQRIIDSGADLSSTTKYGWSGLHISAIRGNTECFQVGLHGIKDLP